MYLVLAIVHIFVFILIDELVFVLIYARALVCVQVSVMSLSKHLFVSLSSNISACNTALSQMSCLNVRFELREAAV